MQWLYPEIQETALKIYKFLIYNLFIQLIAWGWSRMSVFNSSFRWNDNSVEKYREVPAFAGMTKWKVWIRRFRTSRIEIFRITNMDEVPASAGMTKWKVWIGRFRTSRIEIFRITNMDEVPASAGMTKWKVWIGRFQPSLESDLANQPSVLLCF